MGISNVESNARPGICTSTTRPTVPYEGQIIYETDTDLFLIWNGSAWGGISTTEVKADSSHLDGGAVLRRWTGSANYTGLSTANMSGQEAMIVSNGTTTLLSSGTGGEILANVPGSSNGLQVQSWGTKVVGRFENSNQPYAQLRGAGGNWFQPSGPLIQNGPSGFQWGVVHNVGGHFSTTTGSFVAPVTGVYLCSFQTYQQTFSGTSWIHWLWLVGGSTSWNGGNIPYNIFGYSDSAYADGAGSTMMIYVTAGNAIQIGGYMGGDERFYSDYTYLSFRLLG